MSRRTVSSPLVQPLTRTCAGARERRQAPISIGGRHFARSKVPLRPGAFRARRTGHQQFRGRSGTHLSKYAWKFRNVGHRQARGAWLSVHLAAGRNDAGQLASRQLTGLRPLRQIHRLASWFPPGEH
jgi:hypothetical protein